MPERFEIYILHKRRYVKTLPFLSFLSLIVKRTEKFLAKLNSMGSVSGDTLQI